jgi:competence protein ComEC
MRSEGLMGAADTPSTAVIDRISGQNGALGNTSLLEELSVFPQGTKGYFGSRNDPFDRGLFTIKGLINREKVSNRQAVVSPNYWSARLEMLVQEGRARLRRAAEKLLPEPHSTLVFSLAFGAGGPLPPEMRHLLKVTGMSHALAVSGFHLTLFLKVNQLWLSRFRSPILLVSLLAVVAFSYALIVGLRPPIVRAVWMTLHQSLCVRWWRIQYRPLHSLLFFSVTALLYQPALLQSIAFQLSISATAGILILVPVLTKTGWLWQLESGQLFVGGMQKTEQAWSSRVVSLFREAAVISLAAQLATAPLILFHFGEISIVSIIVSTLTVWLIPLLFTSGLLLVAASLLATWLLAPHFAIFLEFLVQLASVWLWFWSDLLLQILHWFAAIDGILVGVGEFPGWGVAVWWSLLLLVVAMKKKAHV